MENNKSIITVKIGLSFSPVYADCTILGNLPYLGFESSEVQRMYCSRLFFGNLSTFASILKPLILLGTMSIYSKHQSEWYNYIITVLLF